MSSSITNTPASLGFRMPAEWEPHAATWLTWPHDDKHWPRIFDRIPAYWARMTEELLAGEDVHILIHDDTTQTVAWEELEKAGVTMQGPGMHEPNTWGFSRREGGNHHVLLHRVPNNFSWTRDHGPIFVKMQGPVGARHALPLQMIHWKFNGWGEQWEHDLDEKVPMHIEKITGIERVEVPMVLEGGSIDVNGEGSLLTTKSCLLNPNRNPSIKKEDIERHLKEHLGVTNVLWLDGQIVGDDTSGHIDDLARFIGPKKILTVLEEDPSDPNYKPLQENFQRLQKMKDQDGNSFEVVPVNLPAPIIHNDVRLPASYANFYIGNAVVLLPIFKDPNDAKAVEVLTKAFPTRKIVPIDARDLIWGFGAFHCVTQQQPV